MASTISTIISKTVTLGATGYTAPLTITSAGTIDGTNGQGGGIGVGTAGSFGLDLTISGDAYNAGLIQGGHGYGSSNNNASGSDGGTGAYVATGTLVNTGRITGGTGEGFYFTPGGGGDGVILESGTLINGGTISGGAGGVADFGGGVGATGAAVSFNSGLLIDSGFIDGTILFGAAAVLEVESGASFAGTVSAGTDSAAVLELGGSTPFALTGIGTSFTSFATVGFAAGALGTIAGNTIGLASGQAITGFTFGDTIDLTGFAATTKTFVSGTGLILSNGITSETLHLQGRIAPSDIQLSADGATGTDITEVFTPTHTLYTSYSGSITLSPTGQYLSAFSITNTGSISANGGASGTGGPTTRTGSAGAGGGVALTVPTGDTASNSGRIQGGRGGAGGYGAYNGGVAGMGGAGLSGGNNLVLVNAGTILAGAGGNGGSAGFRNGGAGGTGGTGLSGLTDSTLDNTGDIGGGGGGTGGLTENESGGGTGGAAGSGGTGLASGGGNILQNDGSISGGNGGAPGAANINNGGAGGAGGAAMQGGAGDDLTNTGTITGGTGGTGDQGADAGGAGGNGGNAIDPASGETIDSSGTITGGAGGSGATATLQSGNGGTGANAISQAANDSITNAGVITGGAGQAGAGNTNNESGSGGAGGAAITSLGGNVFGNQGAITGGAGGNAGVNAAPSAAGTSGAGGDALMTAAGDTLTNAGTITGGTGGTGPSYATGGGKAAAGGAGGAALDATAAGDFINNNVITGGKGGIGGSEADILSGAGGAGGDGADLAAGSLNNTGAITGGAGGAGGSTDFIVTGGAANASAAGGRGGAGLNATGAVTLFNSGTLTGGAGGAGGTAAGIDGGNGGAGGVGVDLTAGDTLTNTGTIIGGAGGAGGTSMLDNQGVSGAGGTGAVLNGATLIDSGFITGTGGADALSFGALASTLIIESGASFSGNAVADAAAQDTLAFAGASTQGFTGIGSQFLNFTNIEFESGASWLAAGNLAGLADGQTISGFTAGDTIELTGVSFTGTSSTYGAAGEDSYTVATAGTLSIDADGTVFQILMAGATVGEDNFVLGGDDLTITEEVTCFAKGTRIATARGEIAVEELRIGDEVRTLHAGLQPVKWIGVRSYAAPFANHAKVLPVCIKANAIADGVPARDLLVSPGHAICIDDALIHAALLVNGVSITQAEAVESVIYFHIELETHEVVFAENCPAESFVGEYFRMAFQNAADYARLYPGQAAPEHVCLPQLASGFQLAAIQRRLCGRAGIAAGLENALGQLRGYIDQLSETCVSGWAQSADVPDAPVYLDIFAGSARIGRVLANLFRQDVRDAGYGAGYHGFEYVLSPNTRGDITIRRSVDQTLLGLVNDAQARAA